MPFFSNNVTNEIQQLLRKRTGEIRIGSQVEFIDPTDSFEEALLRSERKFVILGIPEDIGVRANFGRGGAHTAFYPAMENFLNQQSNDFLNGYDIIVAGALKVDDLMKRSEHLNPKIPADLKELRDLIAEIDSRLVNVIELIVESGKLPLIIGGGHNNAYGNITGTANVFGNSINVINCDPHSDFRALEGRHSGNGFSYAYNESKLQKYCVLAMHEQYNNSSALDAFKTDPERLMYQTFEDIFVREIVSYETALTRALKFVSDRKVGVELDLDAITNVPSSAKTSSGISSLQARRFAYKCGKELDAAYLHIAEGAPVLAHRKADNKTGKLIAYLISDFIKGVNERLVS